MDLLKCKRWPYTIYNIQYTHMLASVLRRYSLCDCVRPDFNFQTIVCMRVGGGTVAGTTSTTQDCLCGGSKRALLPDMVDVPSGEACHTWRQIQPHASSHHTHTRADYSHSATITVITFQPPLFFTHFPASVFIKYVHTFLILLLPNMCQTSPNISQTHFQTFPNI